MAVASVSPTGWQDAIERGFERAKETARNLTGLQVVAEKARVEDGRITECLATMQVIFILDEGSRE